MATQTYWLADPDGRRVPADGAARRDELLAAGWVLADEPARDQPVWCLHPELGAYAAFGAEALPAWEARGWVPTAPPMEECETGPYIALPPLARLDVVDEAKPKKDKDPKDPKGPDKDKPEATPKADAKKETDRA